MTYRALIALLIMVPYTHGDDAPGDTNDTRTVIGSVAELRLFAEESGNHVHMLPGTYAVTNAMPDNATVFAFSGSSNHFDLSGVTIQIDTRVLANMRGKTHSLCTYRVTGDRVTFAGGTFEDIGDAPPSQSLAEFGVWGNHNTFSNCTVIIRGSAPYGYGDLFGKDAGTRTRLRKHSAMAVLGHKTRVLGCRFFIHALGHAIHMHGALDTLVENTTIEGELRPSDEILAEKDGLAAGFGYKDMHGQPIPEGVMVALAEDGIRAYVDGGRGRPYPRTGDITVINCTVKRMRGGIALALSSGKSIVSGCTVIESGYPGYGYGPSSKSLVWNCRGDATYVPLLHMGYSSKSGADIELELLETAASCAGNDTLARINGKNHRVTIMNPGGEPLEHDDLRIVFGQRYRPDGEDPGKTFARNVQLVNETEQPVFLSNLSADCTVRSRGPVRDKGHGNRVTRLK